MKRRSRLSEFKDGIWFMLCIVGFIFSAFLFPSFGEDDPDAWQSE